MTVTLVKKLRFSLRLFVALLAKYYPLLGIGIILGSVTFFVLPYFQRIIPQWRDTESIAVVGRYTLSDIPLFIQSQISQGLTTLDPSGLPQPAIAKSWSVSDNGRTYTFLIDPHLTWQDGTPLKAADINYKFRDTTTEYVSDTQLVMKLKDPYAPLPVVMSRPVFKKALVGTGSYEVKTISRNGSFIDSLRLVPTTRDTHQPNLIYRFYATESAARLAFKLGAVRSIVDVQDVGDLGNWPNAEVVSQSHPERYVAVFFNTRNKDFTGSAGRDLRLSLAYAIDKNRWPERIYGPINPNSWAYTDDLKKYDLDLTRAKQLLTKVDHVPDEIVLSTVPAYLPVAESVKADWEKIGLKVNIIVAAEPTPDFQALVFAQAIPVDPDQYNLWHSTQATNLTGMANPRIDKLLEDGRKTIDLAARKKIYQDFQKFLVDETPLIFLFHPTSYTITRD